MTDEFIIRERCERHTSWYCDCRQVAPKPRLDERYEAVQTPEGFWLAKPKPSGRERLLEEIRNYRYDPNKTATQVMLESEHESLLRFVRLLGAGLIR